MRYETKGGIITDNKTGLQWQQGQSNQPMTWEEGIEYCKNLRIGGHDDWRMPNDVELGSVINRKKRDPATDMPRWKSSGYWSSTTGANYSGYAWLVNFHGGNVNHDDKSVSYYVRAVRGGQPSIEMERMREQESSREWSARQAR